MFLDYTSNFKPGEITIQPRTIYLDDVLRFTMEQVEKCFSHDTDNKIAYLNIVADLLRIKADAAASGRSV